MSTLNFLDLVEDEQDLVFPPQLFVEDEQDLVFPPQLFVEDEDENVEFDVHPQTETPLNVQPEMFQPGLTEDVDVPFKQSAPIRNPKAIKKKGRPRTVMLINHSDKVVRSLRRKHNSKGKDKVPKKKQSNDRTEDASGTQHAVINVTPNLVGMAQIEGACNTSQSYMQSSQSHMSIFLNSQDWRGSQQSI